MITLLYEGEQEFTQYFSVKDISKYLRITKSGIYNLIKAGKFPEGTKLGGSRRWKISDVDKWVKSQEKEGTKCAN